MLSSALIVMPIPFTADDSPLRRAPSLRSCSCSSFYFLLYLWPQAYGQGPHSFHFRLSLPMLFYRAKLLAAASIARRGGVAS